MDNFVFKVPKLPEDEALHKRKKNNLIRTKNCDVKYDFHGECQKASHTSLFNQYKRMGNNYELEMLKEAILEDVAQPSTSQCRKVSQTSSNKIFYNSFPRYGRDGFQVNTFCERHNNFVNATISNNQSHSIINSGTLSRMKHSAFGENVTGNGSNFSVLYNNHQSSVINSWSKDSFLEKNDTYRGNSRNYFQKSFQSGKVSMVEPNHTSMGLRKSLFNSDAFPKKFDAHGVVKFTESRSNFNSELKGFDCMTSHSSIQKNSPILLNGSQNETDKQSFMMSVLQMSLVSMKEEIMNKLENLGQSLLRNAPELGGLFAQTNKDIKKILEKRICFNPVLNTNGFSTLSSTSGMIGCLQRGIWKDETNRKKFESFQKPSSVLQNLALKEHENQKCEFTRTFTMKRKKNKNLSDDDDDDDDDDARFQEGSILGNFSTAQRKLNNRIVELNLKEWYPVIQKNSLTFMGLNEDNVEVQTGIVKKRINSRKVILENGAFCNLLGNPSNDKRFPNVISAKIKNGLHQRWRELTALLAAFEKSELKEKSKLMEGDVSTTTKFETSLNETVMTRSTAKLLKISTMDKQNVQGNTGPFCSKKGKLNARLRDDLNQMRKSDGAKSKSENIPRKRSRTPVQKFPAKIQKTNSTKGMAVDGSEDKRENITHIFSITRSGRIVKRPKDILAGGISTENDAFKSNITSSEVEKNIVDKFEDKKYKNSEEKCKKQSKENQPAKNIKVKNQREKLGTTVNCETTVIHVSPVATKTKKKTIKVNSKPALHEERHTKGNNNPWGNDIDGLEDICLPDISIHHEEITSDPKKLKLLTVETPPFKNIRSNLTFLENHTPVQSPDWQVSRHTRSAVKKFEKLRAQAFKTRIPMENPKKRGRKLKNQVRSSKDIDTVVNWIGEREIRSPRKCSNVINYLLPKRNELQEENEDSGMG